MSLNGLLVSKSSGVKYSGLFIQLQSGLLATTPGYIASNAPLWPGSGSGVPYAFLGAPFLSFQPQFSSGWGISMRAPTQRLRG